MQVSGSRRWALVCASLLVAGVAAFAAPRPVAKAKPGAEAVSPEDIYRARQEKGLTFKKLQALLDQGKLLATIGPPPADRFSIIGTWMVHGDIVSRPVSFNRNGTVVGVEPGAKWTMYGPFSYQVGSRSWDISTSDDHKMAAVTITTGQDVQHVTMERR